MKTPVSPGRAPVLLLLLIDRRIGEGRPRGLFAGIFCGLYFLVRFHVEFAKEYLRFKDLSPDPVEQVIRILPTAGLTMGQYLSIVPFLAGMALLAWAGRRRLATADLRPLRKPQPDPAATRESSPRRRRRRKR